MFNELEYLRNQLAIERLANDELRAEVAKRNAILNRLVADLDEEEYEELLSESIAA